MTDCVIQLQMQNQICLKNFAQQNIGLGISLQMIVTLATAILSDADIFTEDNTSKNTL